MSAVAGPRIPAAAQALPPHYASQDALLAEFRELWGEKHFTLDRLEQLHRAVRVGGRHLALPLEQYAKLDSFAKRNDAWIAAAVDIGEKAPTQALLPASLRPHELAHLYFVTVTALPTPLLAPSL